MRAIPALLATLFVTALASADSAEWAIDPAHSHVGFTIAHLVVSSVEGRFKTYAGKVMLDDADLTKSAVDLTIPVNSLDTGDAKRDEHLKSPDFFDAKQFPNIIFHSTKIARAGKDYKVTGDLTMHGVSKSVTLNTTLSAPIKAPWGNKQVRGAKVSGTIKRADFGLTWNKKLDAGGLVVGEDVALDIALEINK